MSIGEIISPPYTSTVLDISILTPLIGVAAAKLAFELGPGHRIVTLLCDSGTRHLSKFWAVAETLDDTEISSLNSIVGLDSKVSKGPKNEGMSDHCQKVEPSRVLNEKGINP